METSSLRIATSWALASAAAACIIVACGSFDELSDSSDGADGSDGSSTTSESSSITTDGGHVVGNNDAPGQEPDAIAPQPNDAQSDVDAGPNGAPCSVAGLVIGSQSLADAVVSLVTDKNLAAYGYAFTTNTSARVQCANVYVTGVATTTTLVHVGVYSDATGNPTSLLASTSFKPTVVPGWNHAPLDQQVSVAIGARLWIGVSPLIAGDQFTIDEQVGGNVCGPTLGFAQEMDVNGALPASFVVSTTNPDHCLAAMYLSL